MKGVQIQKESLTNDQDRQIMLLIKNDQTFDQGFTQLVVSYQEKLYWHIRRLVHNHRDADDILQNTFIKVFKHIHSFKEEAKLFTWLYRIATNEAFSFLKKEKRLESVNEPEQLIDSLTQADPYIDAEAVSLVLKKAIETLPAKQRTVFNLRYYDEMSYKDMSETLQTSIGALKASYHHAVRKVEEYLTENFNYVNG